MVASTTILTTPKQISITNTKSCKASQHKRKNEIISFSCKALLPKYLIRFSISIGLFVIPLVGCEWRRMDIRADAACSAAAVIVIELLSVTEEEEEERSLDMSKSI